ncbi:MAG: hypothetical protein ABI224_09380 [Acetobacteraceae bacterium]
MAPVPTSTAPDNPAVMAAGVASRLSIETVPSTVAAMSIRTSCKVPRLGSNWANVTVVDQSAGVLAMVCCCSTVVCAAIAAPGPGLQRSYKVRPGPATAACPRAECMVTGAKRED